MIYMDNAATARLHPEVINAMLPYMGKRYANPSGAYTFSADVKNDINNAEAFLAKTIQAKPQEIYITSGGTESDNWGSQNCSRGTPQGTHYYNSNGTSCNFKKL